MDDALRFTADRALRVDAYLAEETDLSRSQVQRLIREGSATVNGEPVKPNCLLRIGDAVQLTVPAPKPASAAPEDIPLHIVYEDGDLAVIDKPQGMVVHPAPGHDSGTLVNALLYAMEDLSGVGGELRPGIVHRIDRMTSGLLVVAKNDAAHRGLSEQFKDHSANRAYIAIAEGNFSEDTGTVDAPVGRHPTDRKRMAVAANGREAVTHWRVLERFGAFTLLQLTLETGRTHQIRVHMAHLKHPLAGDDIYGPAKQKLGLAGQALHGYRLRFVHPGTGEPMVFYAPMPDYFLAALKKLGYDGTVLDARLKEWDLPETGRKD